MIRNQDLSVQTLVKLGLTSLQAKIYLTIVVLQKAEVSKIAALSKVARPDVYRVLPMLEKMGLVRKIIATPTMYEATPLKEACDLLLQHKKDEYSQVQQNMTDLINDFYEKNRVTVEDSADGFQLVSSRELLIEKFQIEDSIAKTSIDVIGDWAAIRSLVSNHLQLYQKALKRGVKIRMITQFCNEKLQETLNKENNPLFEIRYLSEPVPIKAAVYDGKRANMCVRALHDSELEPSLWSDNSEFVKVIVGYFESIWSKAQTCLTAT